MLALVSGRYLDSQSWVRARVTVRRLGLGLVFGLGLGLVITIQVMTVQILTVHIKTGNC